MQRTLDKRTQFTKLEDGGEGKGQRGHRGSDDEREIQPVISSCLKVLMVIEWHRKKTEQLTVADQEEAFTVTVNSGSVSRSGGKRRIIIIVRAF